MIKKWQIGDQIQDRNRGEVACHPGASWGQDLRKTRTTGDRALPGFRRLSHADRDELSFTQFPGNNDSFKNGTLVSSP
jgi:hypothetical protein